MRFETPQTTPFFLTGRFQLRMLSFAGIVVLIAIVLNVVGDRQREQVIDAQLETSEFAYEVRRENTDLELPEDVAANDAAPESTAEWSDSDIEESSPVTLTSGNQDLFKSRRQERSEESDLFQQDSRSNRRESNDFRQAGASDAPSRQRFEDPIKNSSRPILPTFGDEQTDDSLDQPIENSSPPVRKGRIDGNDDGFRGMRVIDDNRFIDEPSDFQRPRRSDDGHRGRTNDLTDDDLPQSDPLDRRQTRDAWIDDPSDAEPFREDFASVHIKKEYLDLVKDNELGIRRDEAAQFYWLLDHARRVSSAKLDQAGRRDVQYGNLMNDPDGFRGEPITIEGDLWKLYEYDAGRNDYNVSRMYEAWVFTSDSGNHPYRIVCTSLGRGIEPGGNLRIPVRITGYFFKREAYPSNGGVHVAPTLLARRIVVNPMPNGLPVMAKVLPYTLSVIMAIGLALLVTVVAFAIGDERSTQAGLSRARRHPYLSFADIAVPATVPVEQSLKEFAERERRSAISGAYGPLLSRQAAREHAVHDYSASQQAVVDQEQKRHRRQRKVVQHWAARQKEVQAEIESLQSSRITRSANVDFDDELNSDKLEPARNTLQKADLHSLPALVPSSTFPLAQPIVHSSELRQQSSAERMPRQTDVPSNPHPIVSQLHTVVSNPSAPSQISYGASKLSEYETEVAKMMQRSTLLHPHSPAVSDLELSAAAQIERDRRIRDQDVHDQIHRPQIEAERLQSELEKRVDTNTNEIDESELMDSLTGDSLIDRHHDQLHLSGHSDGDHLSYDHDSSDDADEFMSDDSTRRPGWGRKGKRRRN